MIKSCKNNISSALNKINKHDICVDDDDDDAHPEPVQSSALLQGRAGPTGSGSGSFSPDPQLTCRGSDNPGSDFRLRYSSVQSGPVSHGSDRAGLEEQPRSGFSRSVWIRFSWSGWRKSAVEIRMKRRSIRSSRQVSTCWSEAHTSRTRTRTEDLICSFIQSEENSSLRKLVLSSENLFYHQKT